MSHQAHRSILYGRAVVPFQPITLPGLCCDLSLCCLLLLSGLPCRPWPVHFRTVMNADLLSPRGRSAHSFLCLPSESSAPLTLLFVSLAMLIPRRIYANAMLMNIHERIGIHSGWQFGAETRCYRGKVQPNFVTALSGLPVRVTHQVTRGRIWGCWFDLWGIRASRRLWIPNFLACDPLKMVQIQLMTPQLNIS